MQRVTMLIFILILVVSISIPAQTVGDYRTRNSGDWSNAQIWERYNGSSWVPIGSPPNGSETITVLSPDTVSVNSAVSISGTLVNQGSIEPFDSLTITIADGGTYQHDRDEGSVPKCIWAVGSTMLITGVTSTAPGDRDQDYYNLTFDTPNLSSNLNMNLNDNTIGGDVRVINTNFARWYLTTALGGESSTVTIMGDVIVENGTFSVQGTGNGLTTFIVNHYGNIEVTGGNFSISRGSQPGGTTTWYLYEGNFSMSNATTQNSNPAGAKFVFAKPGTQTLTLGVGNTLTALPIEVNSGTTLDMGASALAGSGIFIANVDATLITTLAGGVNEIFSGVTVSVNLENESSYGFNGTSTQVTSAQMPDTVTNLTIDNSAGVILSQETLINGVLRLVSGVFDNTIPFTLGPNATISYEGGSLLVPVSIVSNELNVPETFFVDQNYPNPFNPTTTIRFGLPSAADVTIKVFNLLGQEVANLYDYRLSAGVHELQFDAQNLSSGIYLYRIKAGEVVSVKRMFLLK